MSIVYRYPIPSIEGSKGNHISLIQTFSLNALKPPSSTFASAFSAHTEPSGCTLTRTATRLGWPGSAPAGGGETNRRKGRPIWDYKHLLKDIDTSLAHVEGCNLDICHGEFLDTVVLCLDCLETYPCRFGSMCSTDPWAFLIRSYRRFSPPTDSPASRVLAHQLHLASV